jgi:hypothetical protein
MLVAIVEREAGRLKRGGLRMRCRGYLLVLGEGTAATARKDVHERGGEHGRGDGGDHQEDGEEAVGGEERAERRGVRDRQSGQG